jgi:hypothetical protein
MLIEMSKIGFDEQVSLRNHLFHRQKQNCTENDTISGTVNNEKDGAQLLENIGLFDIDWNRSRWDSKHRYKFLDFVWPGNKFLELSKKYSVGSHPELLREAAFHCGRVTALDWPSISGSLCSRRRRVKMLHPR